ncbi:MAG: hypothetical protein ACJ73N_01480 [Bryobacteraceae bacterium]
MEASLSYDGGGRFHQKSMGQDAIKLYVDYNNKPHLEVYDSPGKSVVYDWRLPQ